MTKVIIDDRVFQAIKKRLRKLGRMGVRVGVLGNGKGNEQHPSGNITMLELAAIQHFGSPKNKIPARPFITEALKANKKEQAKITAPLARSIIAGLMSNKRAMDVLGVWGTGIVRKHVMTGPHMKPKNKPSTEARKGSTRPLVDKQRMIGSVTHEVIS